jgi:hypothetical protein
MFYLQHYIGENRTRNLTLNFTGICGGGGEEAFKLRPEKCSQYNLLLSGINVRKSNYSIQTKSPLQARCCEFLVKAVDISL